MRVICVCNQKGGTGKTTTACALLTGATARGYKAIGIDMEMQGNFSRFTGADMEQHSIADVLKGKCSMQYATQNTENGDIIPASIGLAGVKDVDSLKKAIQQLQGYDIAIIDSPPTLTPLLLACIRAANEIIIPVCADAAADDSLQQTCESIRRANPDASILGVLVTMYDSRTVFSRDMLENLRDTCQQLQLPLFDMPIKCAVAVKEAHYLRKSIFAYAPRGTATAGYTALLDAIGIKEGGKGKGRRRK